MPSANHPGGPGTKGKSFKGTQLPPVEPGEAFPNSRVRHGTTSGHRKHTDMNQEPCESCRTAKAQYDARRLDIPENTQRNRIRAKAQNQALQELRRLHENLYRVLYRKHADRLLAEAGLAQKQKQSFKTYRGE